MNANAPAPDFVRRQYAFAAHIRDPDGYPPPADVDDRHMAIYRELFFNNVEGLLATNFPVLKSLLGPERWRAMIRDFLVRHHCKTPLFTEIGRELIQYLQDERPKRAEDPPFLVELAHYEWVELAVALGDETTDSAIDPDGDLLSGVPVLSVLSRNLSYCFPVHRIGPEYQPQAPGDALTHLVVYRDRLDTVRFLEINALTQRLLELLKENPGYEGLDVLNAIAGELQHPKPASLVDAGAALLEDLRTRGILLGTLTAERPTIKTQGRPKP